MKIGSRLKINALLSVAATLVVSLVFFLGLWIQNDMRDEARIADDLQKGASELDVFSNTYLRFPEERPREQWLITYNHLVKSLEGMQAQKPVQRLLVARLKKSLGTMKILFDNLIATYGHGAPVERGDLLGNLLLIKSREISLNAARIATASDETIREVNKNIARGITAVALMLMVITIWLSMRIAKTISDPIQKLRAGVETIGSGNLDFRMGKVSDDELGQLSVSFDHMTQNLQATTVSLDKLMAEIVAREHTEEALQESENRYGMLFNSIDEGFCIVEMIFDENGKAIDYRFLETNPSFEAQSGLVNAQGKRIRDFAPQLEDYWFEVYGNVALTGQSVRFENRATQLDRWFDAYAFRVGRPEKRQVAVLFSDITERKQAEAELLKAKDKLEIRVRERTAELNRTLENLRTETEERFQAVEELRKKEQLLIQQSRLAAMGEMLVNISHQWRQPLNLLGLILQDLYRNYQRGSFTAEFLGESIAKARQVIAHMSQTIDDFKNFLSPDKAKVRFDIKEVMETTLSMIRDSLKGVQVEMRVKDEDISVEGYRNEYAQVIMNILINARDAFRERRVANPRIVVTLFKEHKRSVVTIADNAGGIPDTILDKIFDPYFTTKDPDKGTGIGLFMSKTIIENNMNGALTVHNTDEGAEFRIEV